MSYQKPFKGLKVIDFSQGVAGPYCGMLLAQHGAEVIKVEPKDGDWARNLGQEYGEHSAFSVAANLGKKSIIVDLKNTKSQPILDTIIKQSDIFIEGFRPGVIKRLGYDYDRLKKINPKLIYLSISGFGQNGPMSHKPAMDPVLQAFTGFMALANAINNAGSTDPEKIRQALVNLDMSSESLIVPYRGIKFGADGQNEKTRGILMQVQNGKYCTVYPFELAACELKYPMPTWSER